MTIMKFSSVGLRDNASINSGSGSSGNVAILFILLVVSVVVIIMVVLESFVLL